MNAPGSSDQLASAISLADVRPERLEWLSRGRLAAGKVTVLDGDPGLGKSSLLCEWAARLSRGEALPDGRADRPRGVVLLTAEDGLADTVRPRLEAAGGDLARVVAVEGVPDGTAEGRLPQIPGDLPAIERLLTAVDGALLIVDPLVAYLDPALNSHHDQDVRRALWPLKLLGERTGAAVVAVRHLTKGTGANALYRGGGSIGIIGAARCGLLLAADPDDPTVRVLAAHKANLAQPPPSLAFRLEPVPNSDVTRLVWLGESPHGANGLLAGTDQTERSALEDAEDWLRSELSGGPVPARRIEALAKRAGISPRTLRRARKSLGVVTRRAGFGPGGWSVWCLVGTDPSGAAEAPRDGYGSRQWHDLGLNSLDPASANIVAGLLGLPRSEHDRP